MEMVFRKAGNKLRNLTLRNSTVSTSSTNTQISTKSVAHPLSSESDDDVQFTIKVKKLKHLKKEEGQTSKQNLPESEEELQPSTGLNLKFKYFDNKFNNMQSQLAENSRTSPFKKAKRETEYNFKRIGNKRQFNFNVGTLDDIQKSIHHVENNDTKSTHSSLTSNSD